MHFDVASFGSMPEAHSPAPVMSPSSPPPPLTLDPPLFGYIGLESSVWQPPMWASPGVFTRRHGRHQAVARWDFARNSCTPHDVTA